jgi:hypothetical protein
MNTSKLAELRRELNKCRDEERRAELLEKIEQLEHEARRPVRVEKEIVSFSEEEENEEEEDW